MDMKSEALKGRGYSRVNFEHIFV